MDGVVLEPAPSSSANVCALSCTTIVAVCSTFDSLHEIRNWCNDNNVLLSESKAKLMTIQLPHTEILVLGGIGQIGEISITKLLGVQVDNRLSFVEHVRIVVTKCRQRLHWLRVLSS